MFQFSLIAHEPQPNNRCPYPGDCYISCRQAACILVAAAFGAALFYGMIAAVVEDGGCSHSHSHCDSSTRGSR